MGGKGGTRTETSPTPAPIPPELLPLVNQAVAGSTEASAQLPLTSFTGPNVQNIPGLTPEENQWINSISSWASSPELTQPYNTGMGYVGQGAEVSPWETQGGGYLGQSAEVSPWEREGVRYTNEAAGTDPFEQIAGINLQGGGQMSEGERQAMSRLMEISGFNPGSVSAREASATQAGVNTNSRQMLRAEDIAQGLTGGDVGSSPATLQAMKAWEDLVKPTLMASQALTGNLGGGSTEEALGLSKTAALTPLLSKEIDTRQAIAEMLGQLGLGASGQELAASQTNAELGTRVSEGNANRELEAGRANMQAGLEAAGLDANAAAQLASIAAGQKGRELESGRALGALGGQRAGRKLTAGGQLAQIGGQTQGRKLQAGTALGALGGQTQGRKLQAGTALSAIGTEKANTQITAMSKSLEAAGMPRDVATKQAEAVYKDYLRRQALSEQLTMGPTGNYLAGALTPGSLVQSRQTGGGMFGS
jgi:hypothetical protein